VKPGVTPGNKKMDEGNIGELHITVPMPHVEFTMRQKSAFAVQHMMAAARFSRMCGDIEITHRGEPLGDFYDEQVSCVSATVLLATASLESNINEYFSEPSTHFSEIDQKLLSEFISSIRLENCM
jgi:hypothetical protein